MGWNEREGEREREDKGVWGGEIKERILPISCWGALGLPGYAPLTCSQLSVNRAQYNNCKTRDIAVKIHVLNTLSVENI